MIRACSEDESEEIREKGEIYMGIKKGALVSSIVTIALCAGLIAGSTLALFEQQQTQNIVVTSGKVDVTATIPPETLTKKMAFGDATVKSDGSLSVTNIVPGDSISFDIELTNGSDIPLDCTVSAQDNINSGANLSDVLWVTVRANEKEFSVNGSSTFSVDAGATIEKITVTIQFPTKEEFEAAGKNPPDFSEYEGVGANLSVIVTAVQRAETETSAG